jgi:hypothetical protein
MRNVLSLALILLASAAPIAAAQQTPPPATTPPTARPPAAAPAPPSRPAAGSTPTNRPPSMTAPAAMPSGQTPRPGTAPATPPGPPVAQPAPAPSSWQNVRLDLTISDSLTAEVQTRKTVSMLILDGRNGQVRSMNEGYINVDASPAIRPDGRIFLRLTVEYNPLLTSQQSQETSAGRTQFSESLSVVVNDGKPILLSQAADPRGGNRKVSLEVTATVVK